MTTEVKRDLAADLAFANECQRTESGLTTWNRESYDRATHAIRRAIAAEAEVERLRSVLSDLLGAIDRGDLIRVKMSSRMDYVIRSAGEALKDE